MNNCLYYGSNFDTVKKLLQRGGNFTVAHVDNNCVQSLGIFNVSMCIPAELITLFNDAFCSELNLDIHDNPANDAFYVLMDLNQSINPSNLSHDENIDKLCSCSAENFVWLKYILKKLREVSKCSNPINFAFIVGFNVYIITAAEFCNQSDPPEKRFKVIPITTFADVGCV